MVQMFIKLRIHRHGCKGIATRYGLMLILLLECQYFCWSFCITCYCLPNCLYSLSDNSADNEKSWKDGRFVGFTLNSSRVYVLLALKACILMSHHRQLPMHNSASIMNIMSFMESPSLDVYIFNVLNVFSSFAFPVSVVVFNQNY